MKIKNGAGFTIIELIVVVAILTALIAIVVPNFFSFNKTSSLDNAAKEFVSVLRTAQNKALSSENYGQYGVYLNTTVSPNQYIIFKGASFAAKDSSFNQQPFSLPDAMEFNGISLGGGSEIVFDRLTGAADESGSLSIRLKADTSQNKTIYVASSGTVSFSPSQSSLDTNRVKDSRHLQIGYSRVINTASESITLTFDNNQTETIPINSYLATGELQWQGTLNVGGTDQTVEINTHRLNNPDTLFSIRRDRRYNNKSLKVTISGDSSGYLAQYSADGLTTDFTSANVSSFGPQ